MTTTPAPQRTSLDLPVGGMDCADCAAHIERAVRALQGVHDVQVLVAAERATPPEAERRDVGQIIGCRAAVREGSRHHRGCARFLRAFAPSHGGNECVRPWGGYREGAGVARARQYFDDAPLR
jgi:copper chaperone CopZ